MAKLKDLRQKVVPKILMFGRFGTGKTALTLSYGQGLQILDLDHNLGSGLTMKDSFASHRGEVDVIECQDTATGGKAFQVVKDNIYRIANECSQGKYQFDVLALDSLTSLGVAAQRYILGNSGKLNPLIRPDPRTAATTLTQPEWGLAMNEVENVLNILKEIPIPVIVLAHEEPSFVDGRNQLTISIIGNKLAPKVPRLFSEIWFTRIKHAPATPGNLARTQYLLQTRASEDVAARSCANVPEDLDQNLGLRAILEKTGWTKG